jgi:hypothetical protein
MTKKGLKIFYLLPLSFFLSFFFLAFEGQAATVSCNVYGTVLDNYNETMCRAQGGTVIKTEIPLAPTPEVPFRPGSTQSQSQQTAKAADTPSLLENITPGSSGIQNYIESMYIFLIGMVGIISTIVIMIGGLIWISSMGNAARVTEAKDWIAGAIAGLALALFSYMILFIINPDLVSFKPLNPGKVATNSSTATQAPEDLVSGCCIVGSESGISCFYSSKSACKGNFSDTCPASCRGNMVQSEKGDTCQKYGNPENNVISFNTITPTKSSDCNVYDDLFKEMSIKYDINVALLKAIATAESHCNPNAKSDAGALGVMQLMPATASLVNGGTVTESELYNPRTSIELGAKYLKANQQGLEDWIAGYNGGYGTNPSARGTLGPLADSQNCSGAKAYECCIQPGKLAQTQDYVFKVKGYMLGY